MQTVLRHIALAVPDLQAAELYYQTIFDMTLIGREAELADGQWYTLPFDKGWEDAKAASIELGMVALRRDAFVLALFKGDAPPGQVYFIGLGMTQEEISEIRARLPEEMRGSDETPVFLEFTDPYQITWQLTPPGNEFRTNGDFANRWLKV